MMEHWSISCWSFSGIDCLRGHINRPYRIESAATQPVHYVVAYNQGRGNITNYRTLYEDVLCEHTVYRVIGCHVFAAKSIIELYIES